MSSVAHTTTPGKSRAIVLLALGLAALSCVILLRQTSIEHETTASMVDSSSAATELSPAPTELVSVSSQCANEKGTCTCVGTVKYGAKDKWFTKTVVAAVGFIGCNNAVFGDPIHGAKKTCICEQKAGNSLVQPGFVVAFKGEFGKYCTDNSDKVSCNAAKLGAWEKFTVVDAGGGKVAFKGGRAGLFCGVLGKDGLKRFQCTEKRAGRGSSMYNVWDKGGGKVALEGWAGFCADEQKGWVRCNRGSAGSWETFRVEVIHSNAKIAHLSNGVTFSFRGRKDSKYCGFDVFDNKMKCTFSSNDDRTKFYAERWPEGGTDTESPRRRRRSPNSYAIKSVKSGKWCSLHHDGTEIQCKDQTKWRTDHGHAVSKFNFEDDGSGFTLSAIRSTVFMRFLTRTGAGTWDRGKGGEKVNYSYKWWCGDRGNDGVKCDREEQDRLNKINPGLDAYTKFSDLRLD